MERVPSGIDNTEQRYQWFKKRMIEGEDFAEMLYLATLTAKNKGVMKTAIIALWKERMGKHGEF